MIKPEKIIGYNTLKVIMVDAVKYYTFKVFLKKTLVDYKYQQLT